MKIIYSLDREPPSSSGVDGCGIRLPPPHMTSRSVQYQALQLARRLQAVYPRIYGAGKWLYLPPV